MTAASASHPSRGRAVLLGWATLVGFCDLQGQQQPMVRASLEPQGKIWVGQKVTLVIQVLAPGFFASVVIFDLSDEEGLLLIPPVEHPLVSSETIGDTSYTVQRHELGAVSTRGGQRTIPSFAARFAFRRNPLDSEVIAAAVQTPPVEFTVSLPPGVTHAGTLVSARELSARETWQPDPAAAQPKAGDAFVRTITFEAPDVPAMLFPPFPAGRINGLGIYRGTPAVLDRADSSRRRGERRDRVTYVCERAGAFVVPAVRLTWWDIGAERLRRIDFPARTLSVAPDPKQAVGEESFPEDRHRVAKGWTVAGVTAVALIVAATRWRDKWLRQLAKVAAPFRPVHLEPLNPTSHRNRTPRP